MEIIYIIPARGGSKRLPRKNIMPMCGKPLISFSIDVAKNSGHPGRVVVSTDDDEIKRLSKIAGAEVIPRPRQYANDESPTVDAIIHALDYLSKENYHPDIVVILQPTSPLRTPADLNGAINNLIVSGAKSCISVCESAHPPEWTFVAGSNGFMEPVLGWAAFSSGSKKISQPFVPNGAVYVVRVKDLLTEKRIYFENGSVPYHMPSERSIDIDTMLDFRFAEFMMKGKGNLNEYTTRE